MKKKIISALLFIMLIFVLNCNCVEAEYAIADCYVGVKSNHIRKDNMLSGVTEEMCTPEYWRDKTIVNWEKKLMTFSEISSLNQDIVDGSGTMVFDLTKLKETFDADAKKATLARAEIPTRDLYINGEKINNEVYFGNIKNAILETGYTGSQNMKYGITTNRADIKAWPIDDVIGYSATDPDDEMENSAMNLNEPFAIYGKCEINQNTYYWGYSKSCSGWVNAKNIAICETKSEWTNYWQVNTSDDNFIVVTGSRINLEKNDENTIPIMLGTVLKLVPQNEIPNSLENELESNYIVYFAGNDENGKAFKKYALLNKNLEVNKGFLELTQKNILNVAFSCLGDEYGWGGMNGNMDCSLYTQSIYKCFGLEIPRNTTWQQKIPNRLIDISAMSDEVKTKLIETLPAGSLLYFPGHTMAYIGMDKNKNFIVSDLGRACDENGTELENVYAVNINSLDVKRANGRTWLNNMSGIIMMVDKFNVNECKVSVNPDEMIDVNGKKVLKTNVTYNNHILYEGINYKTEYSENTDKTGIKVLITGLNNFTGTYQFEYTVNVNDSVTKVIGEYTKLISGKVAIPFILNNFEDRVTGKDLKSYYEGKTIDISDDAILKTGEIINIDGENKTIVIYGDTNCDGKVNIMDAVTILNHVKEKANLEGAVFAAADSNNNGKIDIMEAVNVLNVVKGKTSYADMASIPANEKI